MARTYVYVHYLDNEPIYVGSGIKTRPYNFVNRSARWKEKVAGRANEIEVVIISKHNYRWKALVIEGRFIRKHAPHCNQVHVNYEFYHMGVCVVNRMLGKRLEAYLEKHPDYKYEE